MLTSPDSAAVQSATHTSVTSAHPGPVAAAAHTLTPTVLAIDPGSTESAYALIDGQRRAVHFAKYANDELLDLLATPPLGHAAVIYAIEMVASYGMPVGREVFETCVWIGRFTEAIRAGTRGTEPRLVYRRDVKLHHCHSSKAKDSNITQALVDRFAPGQPNHGKGTKASPGWFHGFKADVWQAYALAVYVADTQPLPTPLISVSASVESSLPDTGADTDHDPLPPGGTAALSHPRDGAAPAPHRDGPHAVAECGAGPSVPQTPGVRTEGEATGRRDTTIQEALL